MEVAQEVVNSMRTVRAFSQEQYEAQRFDAQVDASYRRARRIGIVSAGFDGAIHMASNFSFIGTIRSLIYIMKRYDLSLSSSSSCASVRQQPS